MAPKFSESKTLFFLFILVMVSVDQHKSYTYILSGLSSSELGISYT